MTKRVMIGAACATLFAGASAGGRQAPRERARHQGNHGSSAAAKLCAASKKADHAAFTRGMGQARDARLHPREP